MTFNELHNYVDKLAGDRIPQALSEMLACEHLANYLNKTKGTHYDGVSKDETLENDGVDAKIYESENYNTNIFVQVTRSREYDMSPEVPEHPVNLTGQPIIDALEYKCNVYQNRGVFTQGMVLLIVGVTPLVIVRDLLDRPAFAKTFTDITCFENIYYLTGTDIAVLK